MAVAGDWNATTVYNLVQLGKAGGITAAMSKQLVRFQIATGANDPDLSAKLGAADPTLLSYLAVKLADALFAQP